MLFGGCATVFALSLSHPAAAYDGQNCSAPGICWEPHPGYPDIIAGSKYDPKLDPNEVVKQSVSERDMEARNKLRVNNFVKTGKFIYDVKNIPAE
ncbi:MAG: methanol dehydrogenase [Methylocella sp.]